METKTTIVLILLFFAALFVGLWIIIEYGKNVADQAAEYDKKYLKIQKLIDNAKVCEQNYDWILKLLEHLGQLKYKNREMTSVLTSRFFFKYREIARKRVSEK